MLNIRDIICEYQYILLIFTTYLINHRKYSDFGWDYKASNSQIISEMKPNETKINAILDAIGQNIAERETVANQAMHTLEKIKPSAEAYKDANLQFGANAYVAHYLKRIQEVVKERDIKKAENIIRFHCYQQHKIGALDDHRDISLGQAAVAVILEGYVQKFFETTE